MWCGGVGSGEALEQWGGGAARSCMFTRMILLLRAVLALGTVTLVLVGLPTLLAWWLLGGPLGWSHLLIGLLGGTALVVIGGLILGWAMGRVVRR